MSRVVFCTFEDRDSADQAVGNIQTILGIQSIQYAVKPMEEESRDFGGVMAGGALPGTGQAGMDNMVSGFQQHGRAAHASQPEETRMKIICSDAAAARVESVLVGLHGGDIVSYPVGRGPAKRGKR